MANILLALSAVKINLQELNPDPFRLTPFALSPGRPRSFMCSCQIGSISGENWR